MKRFDFILDLLLIAVACVAFCLWIKMILWLLCGD